MDIKPIETIYNGYKFRSRLEARWAVFFDEMGIEYEYEPEGFYFDGEKYLPDFYLPKLETYVEVKRVGSFEIKYSDDCEMVSFSEGSEKYAKFASKIVLSKKQFLIVFGDPFSALFSETFDGADGEMHLFYPVYCQGHFFLEHDSRSKGDVIVHNCDGKNCRECNDRIGMASATSAIIEKVKDCLYWGVEVDDEWTSWPDPLNSHVMDIKMMSDINDKDEASNRDKAIQELTQELTKLVKSAVKARQARFEHGETPKTGGNT